MIQYGTLLFWLFESIDTGYDRVKQEGTKWHKYATENGKKKQLEIKSKNNLNENIEANQKYINK